MKVIVEDLNPVKKRLIVEIPPEDVDKELDDAYKGLGANVAIDGFRKGKVPKAELESRYKGHVYDEVSKKLIESSYIKAVKENNLFPVAKPDINIREGVEHGRPFSYSATVEIKPFIKVEGYIGMELKKEWLAVTDDEINESIEGLRESSAYFKEVGRSAKENDMVVIDFECFIDGKPVDNTKTSDYPVVLDTQTLIPDLAKALYGAKKGDENEVKVNFPARFPQKELAGKETLLKLKVKAVKDRVLPPLDDDFAKDLRLDNVAQLKDKVKEALTQEKAAKEKEKIRKDILGQLIKKNTFDAPPSLVASYLQVFVADAMNNMSKGILPPDAADVTPEGLKEKYAKLADERVKEEMILDAIANQENISVSKEEMEQAIKDLAASRRENIDDIKKKLVERGGYTVIMTGLIEEKVFEFIVSKAKKQ